jgi:hypothetical protein
MAEKANNQSSMQYDGFPVVRWALLPIAIFTIARSLIHIFSPDGGAQSIATIPLDAFTPNGAAAVVHLFALWGLSQLIIGIIYLAVIWRFWHLIPLIYLLLILEYGGRLLLTFFKPFETTGTAPGAIGNYILLPLSILLFLLSLKKKRAAI